MNASGDCQSVDVLANPLYAGLASAFKAYCNINKVLDIPLFFILKTMKISLEFVLNMSLYNSKWQHLVKGLAILPVAIGMRRPGMLTCTSYTLVFNMHFMIDITLLCKHTECLHVWKV